MKNKVTAAILAVFLGGIGVHRFYLGQTGLGIVYLIFFWTLIPSIIALIDFIVLLTMSDQDFDRKYNAVLVSSRQPTINIQNSVTGLHVGQGQPNHQAANVISTAPDGGAVTQPVAHSANVAPPVQVSSPGNEANDRMNQLERLFELKEKGVLSQEEFEEEKALLLSPRSRSTDPNDPFAT